jgi:hypothetical protein
MDKLSVLKSVVMEIMSQVDQDFAHVEALWCDGYFPNMLPLYPIQHGNWILLRRIGLCRIYETTYIGKSRQLARRYVKWEECNVEDKLQFIQIDEPGFIDEVCRVTRERLADITTTLARWKNAQT